MENQRQTKNFKTPSDKEVVLKTYLTARENRHIREAYLASVAPEFDAVSGKPVNTKISGEGLSAAEDALIGISVVSFDGSAENITSRILDGSPEDYNFILEKAGELRKDFQMAK